MLVCHSDASVQESYVGIGWVLFRIGGLSKEFVEAGNKVLDPNTMPVGDDTCRAEYRAMISAVRAATEYDDDAIMVYTDNEPIVNKIQRREWLHEEAYFDHALHSFLGRFDSWAVKWRPRENNKMAHYQARSAVEMQEYLDA